MESNFLASVISSLGSSLGIAKSEIVDRASSEMLTLLSSAHQEWVAARQYFDHVSDPDLIDHAVYVNQAAEKRYMYLLKQARSQGINYPGIAREL
ncbi:MAG: YaaL family protein [Firmicutes bacterium]|nr:YaaL family protein [Dethiobacter sp.]MBS3888317.1 YaaL family protein [Bacillota bacterium]MBS4055431.1 YaaL family protein [Thermaerobacter sp.]